MNAAKTNDDPPTHSAIWATQIVASLKASGFGMPAITTGLSVQRRHLRDPEAKIPFADHVALLQRAADLTGDPCYGFRMGQTRDFRDAGLLAYLGISSKNLGDAIRNMIRYHTVFSDAVSADWLDEEDGCRLVWRFSGVDHGAARQAVEFSLANFINALRRLSRREIRPRRLCFVHARNSYIEDFRRYFGCPVDFAAAETAVELGADALETPIPTSDHRLLKILQGYSEEILARNAKHGPTLVEKTTRLITERLTRGDATIDLIARELGMSTRTLNRRLKEHSLTFAKILDDLRRQLAEKYLKETDISLAQISFLLGYSETSSFNHAVKRWTGKTPLGVRRPAAA